ncbi:hypothetical protein GCM10011611_13150 [Aliidongia dinghuensis]|uniref:NHL repeat-containing protein n=1 Tax=Aliidongia dinghuensis TaxID=1867774 RepID=A0A8J2YQZ3_9PROT|nr:hypothetical protein [Aliidongia dinghuensis]GGF09029.1 hypothetical protein GCM10011611_13150 [Aliidongia dinghuensis]
MRISPIILSGLGLLACATMPARADQGRFNEPGNILITDQFNNRVIEIDRDKNIVYSFGSNDPSLCNPGPGAIIAPNDVERLAGGLTLIAGTGTSTCPDNRVIVVDRAGNILFQYGQAGVAGSGPNQLNTPVFALQTPHGNFLITDQANNRVILVSPNKQVLFSYGPTSGPGALNNPNSAELLSNGHILIADENNSRVIEINRRGTIVFEYSAGLNIVAFASRLPNGDTLITDSGNSRIVEINPAKQVVFEYFTNLVAGSNPTPQPTRAVRLANTETLIADQFNDRVIIITQGKATVFQYGVTNVVGNGPNQLNAPYSAVEIGDYTGLTPPPGFGPNNQGDDLAD